MSATAVTGSRSLLLVFSLPAILQGFLHAPGQSLIQGIYAKHAGVPLAALGTAVLVTRIFDGIIDPLIGIVADAWRRRTGSYKPFIVVGTLLTLVGLWNLFQPPPQAGAAYFTGWFLLSALGWSITEIPYRAWSMQLSSDYVLRTRIQTGLALGGAIGTFAFSAVPLVAKATGLSDTTEFNLRSLSLAAMLLVATMPIVNLLAVLRVPDGAAPPEHETVSAKDIWKAVTGNGPLIHFTLMFLITGVTLGVGQGVTYLFLDGYLGLGKQLAGIMLLGAPLMLIAIPVWGAICRRIERQKVWAVCLALTSIAYLSLAFVPTGPAAIVPAAIASAGLIFFSLCTYVVAPTMAGDLIDYGRWKFGQDHGSVYIAFYSIVSMSTHAVGIALGLILLDWLGYDATVATQTEQGAQAIRIVAAWIPALGVCLAVPFVWFFPLTRERHAQIMKEIAEREGSEVESEGLAGQPATA